MAHGECDGCQDLGSNTARVMVSHAVGPRLRNILRLLEIYATLIAVILVSCIIILECFVVVYKIPYVFPMLPYIPLFPYIPPHLVGEIEVLLQVYYIMLIVVVVGCVGVLFYRAVHKSKKAKNSGTKSIHKTALFEIVMLFAIKMCITIICVKIEIAKIGINTPISYFLESSDWIQMFSLLNAPVSEEITYRVVDIGIPALIVALIMKKRGALLWKYLAGGFGVMSIVGL